MPQSSGMSVNAYTRAGENAAAWRGCEGGGARRSAKNWPGCARSVTSVHGAQDRGRYAHPAGVSAMGRAARAGADDRDRDRVCARAGGAPGSARGEAGGADRGADGGGARGGGAECGAAARDRGAAQRCGGDRGPRADGSGHGVSRRGGASARAGAGAGVGRGAGGAVTVVPRAVRRAAKVSLGAVAGGVACAAVAAGAADGAAVLARRPSLAMTMVVVGLAALVMSAVIRRVQFVAPSARAQRVSLWLAAASDLADLELALTLVAGIHVVIAVTGGLGSPAYPLLYGLVAFAMTVLARPGAVATLAAALLLEAALVTRTRPGMTEARVLASAIHGAYLIGAAAAHVVLLRG